MRKLSAVVVVLLTCGAAAMAQAEAVHVGRLGSEFQVNTYTSNDQENPRVATAANGNFVVVWTSRGFDGDRDGVAGQRYDIKGTPLGTEFQVNTFTSNDQSVPQVAAGPAGNFVVVWESKKQDDPKFLGIFGQRFSSAGTAVGTEFQVNTFTSGRQQNPAVAIDPAGNFVVVWEGPTVTDKDVILGRRYDSTGAAVGSEFTISSVDDDDKEKAAVATDGSGNFTVVWENHSFDGSGEGVAAQRYDSTGAQVGTEFQVNTYTTSDQEHTAIAMDTAGNFIVVWDSLGQDGSREGIFGQRYDSSGATVGAEFQVNTHTTNEQEDPSVALDFDGSFVVVWYSGNCSGGNCPPNSNGQDGSGDGAFGQRFTSTGAKLGTEFQINTFTPNNQTEPKVAIQPGKKFVVVWQSEDSLNEAPVGSGNSVHAQRFGPITEVVPVLGVTNLSLLVLGLLVFGGLTLGRQRRRQHQ